MRRINHLVTPGERYLGIDLGSSFGSLVAPSLRGPLAVLICALGVVALAAAAENVRLGSAEREGAEYARRLAAVELGVAQARAVERDVARLRELEARTAAIRGSGEAEASRIAALGNRVPPGAWLTSMRADRGTLQIEGGGRGLGAVARTLSAFGALPAYAEPRLLSIHESPVRSGVTYTLSLEPRR